MGSQYQNVFTPFTIKGVEYRNRIITSPGVPGLADVDGNSTPALREFHASFARGGAAAVTIGNASLDMNRYGDEARQIDLSNPKIPITLTDLVEGIERYGAVANIEINHPGMHVGPERTGNVPVGPTGIPGKVFEMDEEMIYLMQQSYAKGAKVCKDAGFRMVMLHGAHGNLNAQFVSPITNRRKDKYGGSLENRARFVIEMLEAVRKKCGDDLVIEYRISADEYQEEGMHLEETIEFVKMIEDKIDLLHVSSGLISIPQQTRFVITPTYLPHFINVEFARRMKKELKVPIAVVNSIMNLENAERIIGEGAADMVAMFRPFMADPDHVKKCARNQPEDVRPCLRCTYEDRIIHSKVLGCAVNPILGREMEFPRGKVPKADESKKVAVIGGGVAGMEAARRATERGHDVTLFEKTSVLGGSLIPASALPFKEDMRNYLKWAVRATENCGCAIRMETEATPELIEAEGFDAIIVAAGADPIVPKVPGVDLPHVHWAPEVDMGKVKAGKTVLIVGGGMVGYESAIQLGRDGHEVTIIDMASQETLPTGTGKNTVAGTEASFAEEAARITLSEQVQQAGVTVLGGHALSEVTADGAWATRTEDGEKVFFPADTVLLSVGMRPRKAVFEAFRHLIAETDVYVVGDCKKATTVGDAVHSAFDAVMSID